MSTNVTIPAGETTTPIDSTYGGTIPPVTVTVPPTTSTTSTVVERPSQPTGLAFTGGDLGGLFVLGSLAVIIGALLRRASRSRRAVA